MTVGDMIKRLQKINKDKMCIWKEDIGTEGWANVEIQERPDIVYILPDMTSLFSDGG